jgi:two-component system, NtrC family, sensor kinase
MTVGAAGRRRAGKRGPSPDDAPAPTSDRTQAKRPTREALLAALVERERELAEARREQAATADALRVIGRTGDVSLADVFQALIVSAVRLCADDGVIYLRRGDEFLAEADFDGDAEKIKARNLTPKRPGRDTMTGRVALSGQVEHIADVLADAEFAVAPAQRLKGIRAYLGVPLLRDGKVAGAFVLGRREPGRFSDSAVELAKTFAAQAVIAIENARLFNETKHALERQTATSEVLKVIAASPSDAAPVFEAIAHSARRLLSGYSATVWRFEGEVAHLAALTPTNPEADAALRALSPGPIGQFPFAARLSDGEIVQIPETEDEPQRLRDLARLRGHRAMLFVPLMQRGSAAGYVSVTRKEPGPFDPDDVALLKTFADQAVIAIENARLFNETQEALDQQRASAEVLGAISKSVADAAPVFEAILNACERLFGAEAIGICTIGCDDMVRVAAWRGPWADEVRRDITAVGESVTGRIIRERRVHHIPDHAAEPNLSPTLRERVNRLGSASLLYAPMLWEDAGLGSIVVVRKPPRAFSEREQALLQTFADQAAIAIQNARLFEEVQAKTRDLEESLAQQTATAEVLKVISRSAFDLGAIFQTLVATAVDLCKAFSGTLCVRDGEVFRYQGMAGPGASQELQSYLEDHPIVAPDRQTIAGRTILAKAVEHIPDVAADVSYAVPLAAYGNPARALLGVPLLGKDGVEGALVLTRAEPGEFPARQIEILRTFADQAVIAIENSRLFEEVQAKTRDLEEALAQQTATSEILRAISQSPTDARPVFDRIVQTAARVLRCDVSAIMLREAAGFRIVAVETPEGLAAGFGHTVVPLDPAANFPSRAILAKEMLHLPDWSRIALPDAERGIHRRLGVNSSLYLPLLREGDCIGLLTLAGRSPDMFGPKEIAQAESFRDQALIAIENARLFNETQEALAQQTATADVLKVISRSAFDLQTVLDTLVASAVSLCGAKNGVIYLKSGDLYELKATTATAASSEPELFRQLQQGPRAPGRGSAGARVFLTGEVQNIADVRADPEIDPNMRAVMVNRALLGVPLKRGDELVGAFVLARAEPGAFSARQIEIVQTFADQAVIAIENARLFGEVQARTRELAQSLDDLRKAQDRLIQSEKLASLGQLTAGIAHEIKNPLNFINNFSTLSRELMDELRALMEKAPLDAPDREEAHDLIGMIDANLDKVVSHGQRADSIVKNMLLHSREGSGERGSVNVNAMVEEALNLAYHGARAEKRGFNVTIEKALDPSAGEADVYLQEMTRVLLNLISNGFYATTKRKQAEADAGYEPTISASTRDLGHSVEIVIRDNGAGISDDVKAKMFNPFFTTKPAGEGTGLGLSLSHDIVVKQHGGTIEVATEPGAFTAFTITLPRKGAGA